MTSYQNFVNHTKLLDHRSWNSNLTVNNCESLLKSTSPVKIALSEPQLDETADNSMIG